MQVLPLCARFSVTLQTDKYNQIQSNMKSSTIRVPASFRFQASLLDELKEKAKASNRSLNNYVECLLMDILGNSDKDDELVITPELQKKIDKARKEHENGETLRFENADAAIKWIDSL